MNIDNNLEGFLKCGQTSILQASRAGEAERPCTPLSQTDLGLAAQGRGGEMMSQDELMVQEETVKNDEEEGDSPERLLPPAFQYTVSRRSEFLHSYQLVSFTKILLP